MTARRRRSRPATRLMARSHARTPEVSPPRRIAGHQPRTSHASVASATRPSRSRGGPARAPAGGPHDSTPIAEGRVRRKRQRLGPNGSIESDPAVDIGLERARVRRVTPDRVLPSLVTNASCRRGSWNASDSRTARLLPAHWLRASHATKLARSTNGVAIARPSARCELATACAEPRYRAPATSESHPIRGDPNK